jgi:hypothetical protein
MFAVRATYPTTMQATPMQLVFGCDSILKTSFEASWAFIRKQETSLIETMQKKTLHK